MIKPSEKQKAFMDFKEEETKYEFNVYCRKLNKDLTNLMECLRKQEKDNKAILYLGKNFKKVILPYEEYQKMCQRLEEQEKENEILKEIIKSLFDRGCPLHQYIDDKGILQIEVDDECSTVHLGEFKGFDLDSKLKEVLQDD